MDKPTLVSAIPTVLPEALETPAPVLERLPLARKVQPDVPHTSDNQTPYSLLRQIYQAGEWLFGVFALWLGLAFLSAIPLLQLISLGYLLEAAANIVRTGKWHSSLSHARAAAKIGKVVLAISLFILPFRILADIATDAQLINPDSSIARNWRMTTIILMMVVMLHISGALLRGGKLRYFLWPFHFIWFLRASRHGHPLREARDSLWTLIISLRLPHYFFLGLKGAAGALLWIGIPVLIMAVSRANDALGVAGMIVGGGLLAIVTSYLPFLQVNMAVENRFRAVFAVKTVRQCYRRAPLTFFLALFITVLFALPLYLFKIEILPQEAAWLPGLIFMAFIFPARILSGWALRRARRSTREAHGVLRWLLRVPAVPVTLLYALFVYFTQFTSWHGVGSLFEQHAFMLPVPFISL